MAPFRSKRIRLAGCAAHRQRTCAGRTATSRARISTPETQGAITASVSNSDRNTMGLVPVKKFRWLINDEIVAASS